VAAPVTSNRWQTSKIAGKKKRRCPICAVLFSRLAQHISQAHNQVLTECPSCYAEIVVKPSGKRRCGECRKSFTIGANGKAVGIRAECPGCYNDFYTEKLGLITCPTCKMKTFFDGKGKPC
jgi:DNA-directed RNA polymerase subunit RPC12/RpoP